MTTIDSLERFAKGQLKVWQVKSKSITGPLPENPVVAISREQGCDDTFIAMKLAEELGMVLYGWEIVEQIAADAQVSIEVAATLDEKVRSDLDDWLADMSGVYGLSTDQYLSSLKKSLFSIAAHGNAIILGRGANFLLPPNKKIISLHLVAPLQMRVECTMKAQGVSDAQARLGIAEAERQNGLWVKKYGLTDLVDPLNYHLTINTALVSPEEIVRIVKEIIRPEIK